MKIVKYTAICALFALMTFVAVYAMLPEPENEPIINHIVPSDTTTSSSSAVSSGKTGGTAGRTSTSKSSKSSSSKSSSSKSSISVEYPLNINTATAEELATIDGITDELAQLIVQSREEGGAFQDKEELKLIKRITASLYNKIQDKLICE